MFRSFIYLDTDKLNTYKMQLEGNAFSIKNASVKKNHSAGFGIKALASNIGKETQFNGEYTFDPQYEYDKFELLLNNTVGSDYYDFVLDEFDITTLPQMCIIRINNVFTVPESFDLVNFIEKFKPMLIEQIKAKSSEQQEILRTFIGNASADVPIISEFDNVNIYGKLNTKYLIEEYDQLDEYYEQDVFILCKVIGLMQKDRVKIFDPLKDFIKFPRAIRRQVNIEEIHGFEDIYINGPVLKVEIIAIYK